MLIIVSRISIVRAAYKVGPTSYEWAYNLDGTICHKHGFDREPSVKTKQHQSQN